MRFVVPYLFFYEIANTINVGYKRKRITDEDAQGIMNDLIKLEAETFHSNRMLNEAYRRAKQHDISIYDAVYVTTANERNLLFYTADKKLYDSLKNKEDSVKWISDYKRIVLTQK